jgi:hypothetical protein
MDENATKRENGMKSAPNLTKLADLVEISHMNL